MKSRNLLPAVLALTLAGPVSAGPALRIDSAPAGQVQVAAREAFSAESIGLVSEYLRHRAEGRKSRTELTSAWKAFYPACDQVIRKFARTVQPGTDVEDCVQDVWADLMTHLPQFRLDRSRGKFTSWLYTVVRSKATNLIRKQSRYSSESSEAVMMDKSPGPLETLERKCDIQAVRDAMAVLQRMTSARSFQVLHLRHMEGKDVSEVARTLRMKPGQVWVTEHRMKKKLKELLPSDL